MQFPYSRLLIAAVLAGSLVAPAAVMAQDSKASSTKDSAPAQSSQDQSQADPLKRPLTDRQRKENEKALRKEIGKVYTKWVNEDVRWIITGEELQAFKQLSNDEERDQFIEQFWLRRDPTPDTVENEYKEEHYRRIAYANERFAAGIQGWRTDRGRIYVVYGAADEIESHPSGGMYHRNIDEGGGTTSTFPFERWRYRYIEGIGNEIILEFVDQCMCNEYRLTMDPSEKDALLTTPGAGLTQAEEMGLSTKADRMLGGRYGYSPFGDNNASKALSNLELMAKINTAPPIKFKDLQEVVDHKIRMNLLPFDVRADFVRVTGDSVLVPVTIQVKNKDITFVNKEGVQRGVVNVFGRVTTLTGRVAQTFEDTVKADFAEDLFTKAVNNMSIYWKALPLRPGRYRLDIVLKDVNGDRVGTWSKGILVPEYSEDKLASSTLILADLMEKVPAKNVGAGNFVIGTTKVRPRVESADGKPASFKNGQRLNFWMQVYNLTMDEKTKKPSATIEYDIVNAQTNKSVMKSVENSDQLANPGEQLTIEKSMALNLDPGLYRLTVKVDDHVSKQTISPSARFTVE
ncbi:MAG TPA: GWxTD domain-containing protein [Clostridia bacterium]|nr:GWxTD domain-containing protein [Clostridia bacterium]